MLEININNYNEMLRYEKDMDALRVLVWKVMRPDSKKEITGFSSPLEYVHRLVKFYTHEFAEDIWINNSILPDTQSRFHSSLSSIYPLFDISAQDIKQASNNQLYKNSGFWEMRKYLGRFSEVGDYVQQEGYTQIVCIGMSGCIIGEYLGLMLDKQQYPITVDHLVLERDEQGLPLFGHMPSDFVPQDKILIVDDALLEARTIPIVVGALRSKNRDIAPGLFVLDIEPGVSLAHVHPMPKLFLLEE